MALQYPSDRRYTTDHEWAMADGDVVVIGITDYAQDSLGDVVFVDLPAVGAAVTAGESCGEIESTKSVSELVAPISGTVSEINGELDGSPDLVNSDPYGSGWLYKVSAPEVAALESLMDAEGYQSTLA